MMTMKRLARRWNVEQALAGKGRLHTFSARAFVTRTYGEPMIEEITDAWKKTSPVELEAYRTDAACNCGREGCDACDADEDDMTERTIIDIPDWENGEGLILNPSWYAAPTGSPEGDEMSMDDYAQSNAQFMAIVHLYWPHVHQYVERSQAAMQDALAYLYAEREEIEGSNEEIDALIEKLENASGE